MLTRPAAQELLDGLSAVSLGASVLVARFGPATVLRGRLRFAFGALCAFFAARATSEALASPALMLATLLIACVLPLAALVLAEGILRRHAPAALKAFVGFGAIAVAVALVVDDARVPISNVVLGSFVVLSLAAVTALLVFRDRATLSRQEDASVDALAVPGAIVTLLTVTDFVAQAPIGLSGIGVAMAAFALAANPNAVRAVRGVLADLATMTVVAAIVACGFARALGFASSFETIRAGAVLLAFLLAASALSRARRAASDGRAVGFAEALGLADTSSLDSFLDALADQPVLAGLRIADGAQLADYDRESLAAALSARTVWTHAALGNDDDSRTQRAFEELGDLMARNEATHAVVLSHEPIRIALLTLPGSAGMQSVETNLALFGKLAAIAAKDRVCV
jgi:hypothetical protein